MRESKFYTYICRQRECYMFYYYQMHTVYAVLPHPLDPAAHRHPYKKQTEASRF